MASKNCIGKTFTRNTLFTQSRPVYICRKCQRLASAAISSSSILSQNLKTFRRHASSSTLTDKLRNKIWGTDAPPGSENPYGAPGTFEQRSSEKKRVGTPPEAEAPSSVQPPKDDAVEDEPEEIPESNATTWEDMPVVGGPDWGLEEWDEEHPFEGYMVSRVAETREEIISGIHCALVEVMTLYQADLPLVIDRKAKVPSIYHTTIVSGYARFETTEGDKVVLVLEDHQYREAILRFIRPGELSAEEDSLQYKEQPEEDQQGTLLEEEPLQKTVNDSDGSPLTLSDSTERETAPPSEEWTNAEDMPGPAVYLPKDNSWRLVSLTDPAFKFAVLKRVMQLTGRRLSDPDIQSIRDTRSLLTHLVKKPKPKKLAETLFTRDELDLPNIEIRGRRYTPIDKEKEIGRWKVIERELVQRGLPVTGNGLPAIGQPLN